MHVLELINFLSGLEVSIAGREKRRVFCTVLTLHADLPAKAQLLNMNQYNGAFSCILCLQPGETFKTAKGGSVHIFPYERITTLRLETQIKQDAIRALSRQTPVSIHSFHLRGASYECIYCKK